MTRNNPGKRVNRRGLWSRAVAAVAAGLVLVALVILPPAKIAAAPPSLPYIEALRARIETGGSFRVLELLDDGATAPTGIGYYMAGHEPGNLAEYLPFRDADGYGPRLLAAAEWQENLSDAVSALVGDDDTFPLSIVPYDEALYWEDAALYPHTLTLKAPETATGVTGTRTEITGKAGAYSTQYTYVLEGAGTLLFRDGHLVKATAAPPADGQVRFYYSIIPGAPHSSFKPLAMTDPFENTYLGKPIYGLDKTTGDLVFINTYAAGALSSALFDTYSAIYVDTYNESPASLTYADGLYELVDYTVDTAQPEESSYLARTIQGLTVVGTGGDCDFAADGGSETYDITYSMVRYAGGFKNSHWFSRYVLDAEAAVACDITYTVVQRKVSEANFTVDQFLSYDLIVVGSGITSLPDAAVDAIMGKAVSPVPTLFVEAEDGLLAALGVASSADADHNYVDSTRYFYASTSADVKPGFEGLFTKDFNTDINNTSAIAGFEPVLKNITDENNLRAIGGTTELLDVRVSMATSLRYILNQRVPRTVHPLTQVRILEIEPANIITNKKDPLPGAKLLFADDDLTKLDDPLNVMGWLQGVMIVTEANSTPHPVTASDVNIFRMSPNELNGKIENLKEQYEIIYFGDSRAHFPLDDDEKETVFTRSALDGLLYMNIGDEVMKGDFVTLGLMDSDYNASKTQVNKADDNRTLLIAGNDITAAKRAEIEAFAAAGYPVVFADDLVDMTDPDALEANTLHIDRWTHLYDAVSTMLPRTNTFTVSQLLNGDALYTAAFYNEAFQRSVSLSKPSIIFSVSGGKEMIPTPYTISGTTMSANTTGRQLRYQFKISDPADPTPKDTTYHVRLYMDANASGRYTEDEVLYIDVYSSAGVMLSEGGDGRYQLKADTEYRLEALLPLDAVGIVPWKLEVEKNTASTISFHGSRTGYTRVAPASESEKKELKVLQIVGWDQYHKGGSSFPDRGNTLTLEGNATYGGLITQLKDFVIDFDTARNDGTRYREETYNGTAVGEYKEPTVHKITDPNLEFWKGLNYSVTPSGHNFDADVATIYSVLNKYDMLIIGFGDCYEGINDTLATAIFQYIEAGKAVLFSHDTTSFINMPFSIYDKDKIGVGNGYWAYSFNQILRPAVGMDYYGISDSTFKSTLAAQNGTSNVINDSTISALKAAGYNIAYMPNSKDIDGKPIPEKKTHGYSTYLFKSPDRNFRPGAITQLNEGQITTYPFNVNLKGFPSSTTDKTTMTVKPTHFQYYSLNMNIEDLVVWYCLADDGTKGDASAWIPDANGNYYHTNDASNGYYIYTMGNVTYSGVGHSYGTNDEEAKLFINTMIAAYRSSSISSEVATKDKDDRLSSYIYFPFDGEALLKQEGQDTQDEMYAAYFSFSDSSVVGGAAGKSTASFYYTDNMTLTGLNFSDPTSLPGGLTEFTASVFNASGMVPKSGEEQRLARNTLYHIYLPYDPVLGQLESSEALRIYFVVTTDYGAKGTTVAYDSVELRKIGLLPLQ